MKFYYDMTLRLLCKLISAVKPHTLVNLYATLLWTSLCFKKIYKPLVVHRFIT